MIAGSIGRALGRLGSGGGIKAGNYKLGQSMAMKPLSPVKLPVKPMATPTSSFDKANASVQSQLANWKSAKPGR